MAKRKKSKKSQGVEAVSSSPMPMEKRANVGIEESENGFVIRVSGEGLGGKKENPYQTKTFVALDHPSAIRLATQGFTSMAKKMKGKGKEKKKGSSRKRV